MNHLQNLIRKKEYHWGRYICVDLHLEKINKREYTTTMKLILRTHTF